MAQKESSEGATGATGGYGGRRLLEQDMRCGRWPIRR